LVQTLTTLNETDCNCSLTVVKRDTESHVCCDTSETLFITAPFSIVLALTVTHTLVLWTHARYRQFNQLEPKCRPEIRHGKEPLSSSLYSLVHYIVARNNNWKT